MSLVSDVRILIDEQGGGVFWTDLQVFTAINQAQIDVWVASGWDTIKTLFTVHTGDDLVAFDPVLLIPQYFILSNKKYFPTTMAKLEQFSRQWRGTALAQPRHFAMWDAKTFRVFPRPDQDYQFELWGVRYPPSEIAGSSTAGVAASLITTCGTFNSQVLFTAVTAGIAGNSIRIKYIKQALPNIPMSIDVVGTDITIHIAIDGAGNIVNAAHAVPPAINTNSAASALVVASNPGAGTDLICEQGFTNLTGGVDSTSSGTFDIDAPALLKRAIVERAAARLFVATRPDLTEELTKEADEYINRWNIQLRNRQSHRIWRLKPLIDLRRDQFPKAQSGVIKLARGFL